MKELKLTEDQRIEINEMFSKIEAIKLSIEDLSVSKFELGKEAWRKIFEYLKLKGEHIGYSYDTNTGELKKS